MHDSLSSCLSSRHNHIFFSTQFRTKKNDEFLLNLFSFALSRCCFFFRFVLCLSACVFVFHCEFLHLFRVVFATQTWNKCNSCEMKCNSFQWILFLFWLVPKRFPRRKPNEKCEIRNGHVYGCFSTQQQMQSHFLHNRLYGRNEGNIYNAHRRASAIWNGTQDILHCRLLAILKISARTRASRHMGSAVSATATVLMSDICLILRTFFLALTSLFQMVLNLFHLLHEIFSLFGVVPCRKLRDIRSIQLWIAYIWKLGGSKNKPKNIRRKNWPSIWLHVWYIHE